MDEGCKRGWVGGIHPYSSFAIHSPLSCRYYLHNSSIRAVVQAEKEGQRFDEEAFAG